MLSRNKHSSLFTRSISQGVKKFYNIGPAWNCRQHHHILCCHLCCAG